MSSLSPRARAKNNGKCSKNSMSQLKDFIPDAQYYEERNELEKAAQILTDGIKVLDHWRLYGARANVIIKVQYTFTDMVKTNRRIPRKIACRLRSYFVELTPYS